MAVEPRLLQLGRAAQTQHQALIDQANAFRNSEARLDVADRINAVRRDFMGKALLIVGVPFPFMLNSEVQDQAYIIAINDDFEDTLTTLRGLAANQTLAKTIESTAFDPFSGPGDALSNGLKAVANAAEAAVDAVKEVVNSLGDAGKALAIGAAVVVLMVLFLKNRN